MSRSVACAQAYDAALDELGSEAGRAAARMAGRGRESAAETFSYDVRGRAVTGDELPRDA